MELNISAEFVSQVKQAIQPQSNIVILSHKNPDGDAMGSGLAIYNFLKGQNLNVHFIIPDSIAKYLLWMPGAEQTCLYHSSASKCEALLNEASVMFLVDFNHPSRLDKIWPLVEKSKATKFMIDHHPYPENITDYIYSRVSSSSTAEMVFELLHQLNQGQILAKAVSECLMVGLITDTGSFSYNSSNPLTFQIVAELLKSGIDKNDIIDKLFDNSSESRLRLLGYTFFEKMVVLPHYKTAYIALTADDLKKFNHEPGDTEGFVNYPLSIKGIVFSAIFMERDGVTKCSFRSKGAFPANKVASEHFNGGGHANAAGGETKLSITEAVALFNRILPQYERMLP